MKRKTKSRAIVSLHKDRVRKWAIKEGRKVLWKDKNGVWHAATNRANTPHWAVETEDVK